MSGGNHEISVDVGPLINALKSLSELAQSSCEIVHAFLDGIDAATELVRIDIDGNAAPGANDLRIVFQPADRLVDFLATARTREADRA